MPVWPHSLPVMAVIALIPPLWRRVMARALNRLPGPAGEG
jgi:alkane 1-monooxygenase